MIGALTNILLDRVLILGWGPLPAFGILGAGWATLLANTIPCLILAVTAYRDPLLREAPKKTLLTFRPTLAGDLLRIGLPAGIHGLLGAATFTTFTMVLGGLGAVALAASNLMFTFNNVLYLVDTALSQALSIAAARAHGSGDPAALLRVYRSGMFLVLSALGLFLIVLMPFSDFWIGIFADTNENAVAVSRTAKMLLVLLGVRGFADGLMTVYFGILRGLGETKVLMLVRTGVDVCIWIPLVFFLQRFCPHVTAYWATMPFVLALATVILHLRWRHGHWRSL